MTEWLERSTHIRRYGEEKTVTEQFQFHRKVVSGESRLYLSRFENTFIPEHLIGKPMTAPSEHDTTITYVWEYHNPGKENH